MKETFTQEQEDILKLIETFKKRKRNIEKLKERNEPVEDKLIAYTNANGRLNKSGNMSTALGPHKLTVMTSNTYDMKGLEMEHTALVLQYKAAKEEWKIPKGGKPYIRID